MMMADCRPSHSRAVSICKSRLAEAREAEAREDSGALRKEAMAGLESRAAYHYRLARAYGALKRYDGRGRGEEERSGEGGPTDAGDRRDVPSASNAGNDAIQRRLLSAFRHDGGGDEDEPLEFSKFAAACRSRGGGGIGDRVLLTKVKRSRLPNLWRIFDPCSKICSCSRSSTLSSANWALVRISMSSKNTLEKWRPMIRWLHVQGQTQNEPDGDDSLRKAAKLESLQKLRACLLDSLRLGGHVAPSGWGNDPVTRIGSSRHWKTRASRAARRSARPAPRATITDACESSSRAAAATAATLAIPRASRANGPRVACCSTSGITRSSPPVWRRTGR
mmetsp:Transcript_32740/g.69738  ORF Transcript_32740/g.69738 Transcript_32740/m.69738 type:complete len:335 (-) Transcript_32740:642-1646(-)